MLENEKLPKIENRTMYVVSEINWILIIQFDIFLTNSGLDDCAYSTKDLAMEKFVLESKSKQENSANWNDLTMQSGSFQLLAPGGSVGSFVSLVTTPYLASSFPLPTSLIRNE